MSSELERRLEAMFAEPEPEAGAGEEALHGALRALRPAHPARRGLRTAVLVFATAVVLLVIAAGSLAAAGALHVSFGQQAKHRPATVQLSLPKGADGIAAIVSGRLSVVTRGGFRLQGLRASAAALSPHALYVAAGIGHSLVALAPNGRRAWSHPARGRVVAIAWAPDGLRIAYTVRAGRGHPLVLHVIWGNGTHDIVIDRSVFGLRPSWRANSLAFAYVGAGGQAVVYDLAHASRRVIRVRGGALRLAFAPRGAGLAINNVSRTVLVGRTRTVVWRGSTGGIGWLDGRLVAANRIKGLPRHILAFDARGRLLAVAFMNSGTVRVLAGSPGHLSTVLAVAARYRCGGDTGAYVCAAPIGDAGLEVG